jgi:putative transcriptional regulator
MNRYSNEPVGRGPICGGKSTAEHNILADQRESHKAMTAMMRVRLKADGRIVEILPDGSERALASRIEAAAAPAFSDVRSVGRRALANGAPADAAYARGVRARTKLTQAEFAARIGVPIETVRNWEQGKRSPRGPARALLKVIDKAPDVAFAVLSTGSTERSA